VALGSVKTTRVPPGTTVQIQSELSVCTPVGDASNVTSKVVRGITNNFYVAEKASSLGN
jgi:hypothetical protein